MKLSKKKTLLTIKKTSISVVGDTRFLCHFCYHNKKRLEIYNNG